MPVILLLATLCALSSAQANNVFRLSLRNEPAHLEAQKLKSASSNYLIQNLHRNLLIFDDQKGLLPDLAEECTQKDLTITCTIKENAKWSDGSSILASHFMNTYQKMLETGFLAPRADLLFDLLHAVDIYKNNKEATSLGIKVLNERTLEFKLISKNSDFIYSLANPILSPLKKENLYSGPYSIKEWKRGLKVILESNPHYHIKGQRPNVEFYFVDDDLMTVKLFEKDQLEFVRRLPTSEITKYRSRPEYHNVEVARMDYIGFGTQLKSHLELRKAITQALDYKDLQKVLNSVGQPGCPGFPATWGFKDVLCYTTQLTAVQNFRSPIKKLNFYYSTQGDEDHNRVAEWIKYQLKSKLKIDLKLYPTENKMFVKLLEKDPPDLFRKGVAPDFPTCTSLLAFLKKDHPQNFLKIDSSLIEETLSQSGDSQKCVKILNTLHEQYLFIPTGPIHFAILVKKNFTGWRMNQLNQLDLAKLEVISN